MKPFELAEALNRTNANDRSALNDIATALAAGCRKPIDEAVRIWISGDPTMARKAAHVIGLIGDMAIGPLLDASADYRPLQQVWKIRRIVKEQIQRRDEIVAELEKLLPDKTEIPYPIESASIEEPPPDERICDAAYVLLRTLLNPHADPDQPDFDARFFRDLEFEDRDKEINKYLADGTLTDFENMDLE
jgi:hypothetical protein